MCHDCLRFNFLHCEEGRLALTAPINVTDVRSLMDLVGYLLMSTHGLFSDVT